MKKIIIINIFVIIFILFIFEFVIFDLLFKNRNTFAFFDNKFSHIRKRYVNIEIDMSKYDTEPTIYKILPHNNEIYQKFCGETRIEFNVDNSEKNPIYILGCSYAYGHGLKKEESFPSKLSKLTNRPIYNFSGCGGHIERSIQEMKNYIVYNNIKQPQYIIYIYMNDHINRYLSSKDFYDYYYYLLQKQNSNFSQFLSKSKIYKFIHGNLYLKSILKNYPETTDTSVFLKKLLYSSYSSLKQQFPDTKIIFIIYNEKLMDAYALHRIKFVSDTMNDKIWEELQNLPDLEIVRTKDVMGFLFDKDYKLEADIADWHPNERVWEEFTPKFVEKYIDND